MILASLAMVFSGGRSVTAQQPTARPASLSDGMRLATPQVAAQLELTEEQRVAIAGLVTERAEALAGAGQDVEQRRQVQMEYEQKLLGELSVEQRAQWEEMVSEPRLSFQFRLQQWSEVLDWFAEQSGLSLVMDAPPAGSFNYTDSRQYTPTEAIDLLNSVLLSKGYTLIRRDKMLIVLDLTEGIPEGLVPRVPPAELEKRGRFEFVSVLIPLEGRTPDDVLTEVTPLLGPNGNAVALKKTGQILVTDTAGVVRAVSSIIESIPKPSKPPERPPAPSAELTVYPLEGLSSDSVLEVLTSLISGGKFVVDRQADQLNAYALPKEHAAIRDIMNRMKAGDPIDRRAKVETYPISGTDSSRLIENLQAIVPSMRFTVNDRSNRLIAWGTSQDHERIKPLVDELGSKELGPDGPRMETYELPANLSMATTVLSRLAPSAQIVSPSGSSQLMILATENDQRIVAETLARLEELVEKDERRRLKIYPVTPAQRARFMAIHDTLSSEMADLKVITDSEPGQLSIWARSPQHAIVEQLLSELSIESPDAARFELQVYPLENVDVTAARTTLATLLPGTQLIPETTNRRLLAWASPDTHEKIAQALQEIDMAPAGRNPVLEVHSVPRSDLNSLIAALQPLAPEARLATDFGSSTLLIWATPEEHERLGLAVERVREAARGGQRQVRRFELQQVPAQAATSMVQSLVRRAVVSAAPDGKSILVWAEAEDLETVAEALREVDSPTSRASRPLVAYPLSASKLEAFMRVADPEMVRRLQLTADTTHRSVLARGTPEEHLELKELIDQFVEQLPDAETPTAVVYPMRNTDPRAAFRALSSVVPNARLSIDDVGSQLLATASAEDHATIQSLVEQMEQESKGSNRPVLRSHPIRSGNPVSVHQALSELFRRERDVNITLDQSTGTLLAFASPPQHDAIETFLEEMQQNGGTTNAARAQLYPLGEADGTEIVTTLNTLFATQGAQVRISHDRSGNQLIVVAPPEQQEVVRDIMAQLPVQTRSVEVIPLQRVDVSSASQAINRLFSHLNYSQTPTVDADVGSQQLFVRGTTEQIQQIRQLLNKMGEQTGGSEFLGGGTSSNGLRVVPFPGDSRAAIEQLRRIWPRLRSNDLRILEPDNLLPEGQSLPGEGGAIPAPDAQRPDQPRSDATAPASQPDDSARTTATRSESETASASSHEPTAPSVVASVVPATSRPPPRSSLAYPTPAPSDRDALPSDAPLPGASEPWRLVSVESRPDGGAQPTPDQPTPAQPTPDQPTPDQPTPDQPTPIEPPVILVPGSGSITIASDDEEAAEQAEALLRALSGEHARDTRATRVGSQLMVYPLRHTSAEEAAESIERLVRGMGGRGRGLFSSGPFSGNVAAVPDSRLNAVVVYANRSDQPLVEGLLQVLDSPESMDSLVAHRPKLIPLKFAKVERVEAVISSVYRAQMRTGAGRRPITIPSGISSELAASLQQANAAIAGPLLTISSDPVSNTLIVMAPRALVEEIEQLVAELDDADRNDPARSLQVLEFEKVNSERIRDALDVILEGGGNRGRGNPRARRR